MSHYCNARRRQLYVRKFSYVKNNQATYTIQWLISIFFSQYYYSWIRVYRFSLLIFFLHNHTFQISKKKTINWNFHVLKHSFTILVFSIFIYMSIFNRFVKSSKHFIVFKYNTMLFLIELFRTIIMTINTFTRSSEMFIVTINLLRICDFENEFIIIKNWTSN